MADHRIKIKFNGANTSLETTPLPAMNVKQTVNYFSDEGEVLILFPDISPFRTDNEKGTFVTGGEDLELKQATPLSGVPCRCFVRPPGQKQFKGWDVNTPLAGGNHVVK